jgi:hypothetical protein
MDRQYIRDTQVIERYLQRRLTADEEAAFEEAYLGDPELLKELETAELLQRGVKALGTPPRGEQRETSVARSGVGSPRYALAASLVAGIALAWSGFLYRENQTLRNDARPAGAATEARLVPLIAVRGSDANVIEASTVVPWTVLLLDPGFTPYDRYRAAVVSRGGGEELFSVDELTPTYEGLLAVAVPSERLTPGDYDVVLAGRMHDWPADLPFDDLGRTPVTVTVTVTVTPTR